MSGAICRRVRAGSMLLCALVALIVLGDARAQELNYAGLVVDYGDGRTSYALVAFEEEEITAIELLRRSGLDLVTVSFGGLGEGVCQIETRGCQPTECRRRLCQTGDPDSPFWQYVRQTAPGEWKFMSLGASAAKVRNGDIDAWVWTGGSPELPALSIEDVARLAGVTGELRSVAAAGAVPTPARRTVGASNSPSADDDGPSVATIIGAAAVLAVIGGGAFLAARSRGRRRALP